MPIVCVLLALLAAPFWEAKAPKDWSEDDLQALLHDSPWAQMAGPQPEVQVYLATARPMQDAEIELARRNDEPRNEDYVDYIREQGAHNLVLAVAYEDWQVFDAAKDLQRMQDESVMKVGRDKYKMVGYFPPVHSDPFLRLVFPRVVTAQDKSVVFELYVPGHGPYHDAEFRVRDMRYKGRLEM
jgi:hypothetical protein